MGNRSATVSENSAASVTRGGTSGRSGWVSADAATSPSASMSRAPRDPMCSTRPRTWAGQLRAFGQRRSMSPSLAGASGVPHSGQSVGHHEGALGAVAQLDDRAEHLGNDVAGLAQHDGVADEHALRLHDVLVVQRGLAHLASGDAHLLHHRVRRRATGAADADDDVEQLRVHLLGRVLEGDGPARRVARGAELVVQLELVDLDDDAVDLMAHAVAMLAVVADELRRLGGRRHDAVVGRGRQAPASSTDS